MAGESLISTGNIEKRAEDLQVSQEEASKKAADEAAAAEKAEADKKAAEDTAKNPFQKSGNEDVSQKGNEPQPKGDKELRKWATRLSMENAEIKKQLENLASTLSRGEKKVDWKELAKKTPEELQKIVEAREKELADSTRGQYEEHINQATAEITNLESERRMSDAENYPRWAELLPVMKALSEPKESQPNGDPRVNFNRHPKVVLDDLYELAQQIADQDPNWKKPDLKKPASKTFTQEEVEAQVTKAREAAIAEYEAGLSAEKKGAGVGGMGKGATKGKPGEVDKEALWNMPLDSLGNAIKKATERMGS